MGAVAHRSFLPWTAVNGRALPSRYLSYLMSGTGVEPGNPSIGRKGENRPRLGPRVTGGAQPLATYARPMTDAGWQREIEDKVYGGERLTTADGEGLYPTDDPAGLGRPPPPPPHRTNRDRG